MFIQLTKLAEVHIAIGYTRDENAQIVLTHAGTSLLYRRRVPVHRMRSLYKRIFTMRPTAQLSSGDSDAEVVKAWTEAHESFEAMLRISKSQF